MTQTYSYLALETWNPNASTIASQVVIQDGAGGLTNYQLAPNGWTPQVAQLSRRLVGVGLYDDVVEEMRINIRGATANECLDNLAALEDLLDQADRWGQGEAVDPVILKYAPPGSILASAADPYRVAILGRASSQDALLRVPPEFTRAGQWLYIPGVVVRFVRRPQWILGRTSATSAAVANPGVMRAAFSQMRGLSPIDITITDFPKVAINTVGSALYILSSSAFSGYSDNGIQIVELPTASVPSAPFSDVVEGNASMGGHVVRFTPADTAEHVLGVAGLTVQRGAVAIFAAIRNNGAQTYTLRAGLNSGIVATQDRWCRPVPIDASTTNPRIVSLGVIPLSSYIGDRVEAVEIAFKANATGGTLDIDYVVAMQVGARDTSIIRMIDAIDFSAASSTPTFRYQARLIDYPIPSPTTRAGLSPRFEFFLPALPSWNNKPVVDAYTTPHVSSQVYDTYVTVVVLGTTGAKWCLTTGASGAALTATVVRNNAYLTPA